MTDPFYSRWRTLLKRHDEPKARHQESKVALLRARIEVDVGRPGVIAITSGVPGDGKSVTACGLASSLGTAGYRTLLIDATVAWHGEAQHPHRLTLEETALRTSVNCEVRNLKLLSLSDPGLQQKTSRTSMEDLFALLRERYDYIVVDTNCALDSAFARYVIAASDAVLVAVRSGRRQKLEDVKLSTYLGHIGSRFLGVIAVDRKAIKCAPNEAPSVVNAAGARAESRTMRTGHVESGPTIREVPSWQV
jgi:Mrp family chromosome partitioning ATPase